MPNVGDKYIIEIGEVFKAKGTYEAYGGEVNDYEENLYRIKGFNSLVFDENGLKKLEKYEEKEKQNDAIYIGDEVTNPFGAKFFVTFISISGTVKGIDDQGSTYKEDIRTLKRTGRFSLEISKFLSKTYGAEYREEKA